MILKTITAGRLVQQCLYDNVQIRDTDSLEARRQKVRLKSVSYNYWNKNQTRALQALIFANFDERDYFCTLTFSGDALPLNRTACARSFGYFARKLRMSGLTPKYVKCMEHRHGVGRWHIHCIMSGCGRSAIRNAWIYGNADVRRLNMRRVLPSANSKGLAYYMAKEMPDRPGQRVVQRSRGDARLIVPEPVRQYVSNSYQLHPPIGCEVVMGDTLCINNFGQSQWMTYLLPTP